MSQSFFRKLDAEEKEGRLSLLSTSKGSLTIWVKGQNLRHTANVIDWSKERQEIILEDKEVPFPEESILLCSFTLRGVSYFSQVILGVATLGHVSLSFNSDLFKSERRSSFRLLTFPVYKLYVQFSLNQSSRGAKVLDLNSKPGQTGLFKKFLKLVETKDQASSGEILKLRVQDLSVTGMGLMISELEAPFFVKDMTFKDVKIDFEDESITIPEVMVVYCINLSTSAKPSNKFKVGLHFKDLPNYIDDLLGRKISKLMREVDSNKDFEKFLK